MTSRRSFIKAVSILIIAPLSGCITGSMHKSNRNYYNENILSILATKDKSTIVIVGRDHHYVVSSTENLVSILTSSLHKNIKAKLSLFEVDTDNSFKGTIELSVYVTEPSDIEETKRLGFVNKFNRIKKEIEIKGKRYAAGNFSSEQKIQLNEKYTIRVSEPEGVAKKAMKIAVTPLTVAVDGVLLILGIPLFILICTSNVNKCK
jgi:RNase P/RNase MRP subunit p29